jgi:signal transduction histidine kinase
MSEPLPSGYLRVPQDWNDLQVQGRSIGDEGYATLRLKILPGPSRTPLVLRVFGVNSAYRLWVDGRLEGESGRIGRKVEEEILDPSVRLIPIHSDGDPRELVLQISNFHLKSGGLPVSLQLGRASLVYSRENRNWGLAMFFIGSLLVMGIYHLALYAFRKSNDSSLYFGIYCLLWMGNMLCSDTSDWVIRLFLPGLSGEWLYRASQVLFFLSIPVGYRFFRSLYPQEFPAWILRASQLLASIFTVAALGASTLLVSKALPAYYVISIAAIFLSLSGLYRAWRQGREGASYILLGFLFLGFVGINDMLNDMRLIHTAYIIPVGMFIFILFQALALSLRFSRTFFAVENLSAELVHKNLSLHEEMAERIRLEREIVQVSEGERRRISHELHDGLCQLLTGARLRCSVLERKVPKDGEGAAELAQLSSLLEESVDQAYDLSHGLWPVEHDPKDVCTSLAGLARHSAESSGIAVEFLQKRPCETCSNVHITQLYHIAQESIANALKHAQPSRILVTLDCLSCHTVTLTVQDDGMGRAAARETKGGLGLRIMAHRARMLGGDFRIEDGEGRGTLVTCSVPCEGRGTHLVEEAP